jgi:hypothetical protein
MTSSCKFTLCFTTPPIKENIPQSIRALRGRAGFTAPALGFCKLAPSEAGCESKNAFRRMKQPGCCI